MRKGQLKLAGRGFDPAIGLPTLMQMKLGGKRGGVGTDRLSLPGVTSLYMQQGFTIFLLLPCCDYSKKGAVVAQLS